MLERGRLDRFEKRHGLGRAAFLEAWEIALAADEDGLAVDAAHMLGLVEPPLLAEEWNGRAMALARSSSDPVARRWVGSLANNMGWARHEAGDDDEAIALFELAHNEWLADGRAGRARIARWSIARCLRSRGDVAGALATQEELLAELDVLGETDGYVLEEIAECLLALDRPDAARPFFAAHTRHSPRRSSRTTSRSASNGSARAAARSSSRPCEALVLNHHTPDAPRTPDRHGYVPL